MIPNNSMSSVIEYAPYIPPDGPPYESLVSMQRGGIGLSDPTAGLEYQDWTLTCTGDPWPTDFYISAPNTPSTLLYSLIAPEVAQTCSLAFDPNMHPAIAWESDTGAYLRWWNATIPDYEVLYLGSDVTSVQVTLDDKREAQAGAGNDDIICAYTRSNNLYFRQLRDRFTIEYLLLLNVPLANPKVIKVGMHEDWRLQFYMQGTLYQ